MIVGVCTHLGCIPLFDPQPNPTDPAPDWPGGFFCPCHGSKYDLAGRVFQGVPAPYNLPVPPYRFPNDKTVRVGQNPPGADLRFQLDPGRCEPVRRGSLTAPGDGLGGKALSVARNVPRNGSHPLSDNVPRAARPVAGGRGARHGASGRSRRATSASTGSAAIARSTIRRRAADPAWSCAPTSSPRASTRRPARRSAPAPHHEPARRTVHTSLAREWAAGPGLVILCPRFEGVDERMIEARGSSRSRSATTCCRAARSRR